MDKGLDFLKTSSKKVVYKIGVFLGNKTADAVTKSGDDKVIKHDQNLRNI